MALCADFDKVFTIGAGEYLDLLLGTFVATQDSFFGYLMVLLIDVSPRRPTTNYTIYLNWLIIEFPRHGEACWRDTIIYCFVTILIFNFRLNILFWLVMRIVSKPVISRYSFVIILYTSRMHSSLLWLLRLIIVCYRD